MTRREVLLATALGVVFVPGIAVVDRPAFAIGPDQEQAELANALGEAKVSLQQGLVASESEGQPISGKFDEVIIDHMTGKIAKVESIDEGEDLSQAKSQKAAMDRAKVKLADAAVKSMGQAKGSTGDVRVVSVVPQLQNDRPEAKIMLLAGKQFSTASEHLD
jgi:hypothetical protein